MDAAETFARAVRARRLALGLSQEDLAHKAGLDRTYISGIERGVRNPTLKTADRIAHALGSSLRELLAE
jgi:transcriptional regulator with XRE-family HTH domain